ncbi:cob(I)yrinic acid a,c-diamide adenosyltransferase [bacterium B17]|nr:cob(I)yrinic acid a,c-diamide adenosyltransferase [bacterium B17]
MKGCVQIYTGDGKGKTTAALGLTLRASGAGLRVYIGQFIKSGDYSEIKAIHDHLPSVTVEQYGRGCFIKEEPTEEDIQLAQDGLKKAGAAITGGKYDIVIIDEACCAVTAKLLTVDSLLQLISQRPDNIELVFTGRNACEELIEHADLVTEMKQVKHYYEKGVPARTGIEN